VTAPADLWAAALARTLAELTTLAQTWETTAADTRTCPHCAGRGSLRHLAAPPQPCRHCAGTGDPGASRYDTGAADAYRACAAQVRELLAGPA
jgi:DnaJ-class molecular chaperone